MQSDHPLVQTKAVFVDRWPLFAGATHWSNAKLWMKEVTGKKKNDKDHKERSKREIAKVGFYAWALLGLPSDFCWGASQKRRFWIVTRSLYPGKTGWRCAKNPVAGRTRQVVTIRSAVSIWNCPCTKKRSFEAGGRYLRWSLKPGWVQVLLYLQFFRNFVSSTHFWE